MAASSQVTVTVVTGILALGFLALRMAYVTKPVRVVVHANQIEVTGARRPPATGWFSWMLIPIPARECSPTWRGKSNPATASPAARPSVGIKAFHHGTTDAPRNLSFHWRRMLSGALIFIEAAAFRSLSDFSTEAFGGEDVELARRLKHLARTTRKRFVILHRHPVVTSARRMRL